MDEDTMMEEEDCLSTLIVVKWATFHNCVLSVGIFIVQSMSQNIAQICWKSGKKRKCISIW
jgi:hypothetical protein